MKYEYSITEVDNVLKKGIARLGFHDVTLLIGGTTTTTTMNFDSGCELTNTEIFYTMH